MSAPKKDKQHAMLFVKMAVENFIEALRLFDTTINPKTAGRKDVRSLFNQVIAAVLEGTYAGRLAAQFLSFFLGTTGTEEKNGITPTNNGRAEEAFCAFLDVLDDVRAWEAREEELKQARFQAVLCQLQDLEMELGFEVELVHVGSASDADCLASFERSLGKATAMQIIEEKIFLDLMGVLTFFMPEEVRELIYHHIEENERAVFENFLAALREMRAEEAAAGD